MTNIQTIISDLERDVREQVPISPQRWVESAQQINILISSEHQKLFDLQQKVAQEKVAFIENGDSVAKATTKVEASDTFRKMNVQRAYISQLEEHIRLAKKMATLASDEMHNYGIS